MMTFRNGRLRNLNLPPGIVRLLMEIAESKGRLPFYERQKPQLLRALRAAAFVRSVESSNRSNCAITPAERFPMLLGGWDKPRNPQEQMIRDYVQALNLVFAEARESKVTTDFVLKLHEVALSSYPSAGRWRCEETDGGDVCQIESNASSQQAIPAKAVTQAIEELFDLYSSELSGDQVHPLIALAAFVFDFVRIQPFHVGNKRISRLVVVAGLCEQGFETGRYISLEHYFENSRAECGEAFQRSSYGWHEGKHDLLPWMNYFFTIVRHACLVFEQRASEQSSARGSMTPLVEAVIDTLPRQFTLNELEVKCPGVSTETIGRVLRRLRKKGHLVYLRKGGIVAWQKSEDLLREGVFFASF